MESERSGACYVRAFIFEYSTIKLCVDIVLLCSFCTRRVWKAGQTDLDQKDGVMRTIMRSSDTNSFGTHYGIVKGSRWR